MRSGRIRLSTSRKFAKWKQKRVNSVVNFIIKLRAQVDNLPRVTGEAQQRLEGVRTSAERAGGAIRRAFSVRSFSGSLMSLPGMQFLTNPYTLASAGIGAIAKLGSEAEMTAKAFETLVGSQERSQALLKEITTYANATPYDKTALVENAQMMMAFGVEADKTISYLQRLGDIAMGDRNKLQSLALVLGQVKAAGTLNGGDLKQFIGVGFNPLKELSQMTGKTYEELQTLMSKGQITFDNVAAAIAHATSEGGKFHGMSEQLSQTTSGKLSNALGALQEQMLGIFERLKPLIDAVLLFATKALPKLFAAINSLVGVVVGAIEFVHSWWRELALIGSIIGIVTIVLSAKTVALGIYTGVVTFASTALYKLQAIMRLVNITMAANPIGVVVVVIGALIAAVVYCWYRFAGFRAFLLSMWDTVKGFGGIIKDYVIGRINELLGAIGAVGRAIKALFSGDFDEAASAVGEAVSKLSGKETKMQVVQSTRTLALGIGANYKSHLERERAKEKQNEGSPAASLITPPGLKGSPTASGGESVIFGRGKDGKDGKGGRSGSAIATGGQRTTTINMTIGKLIEQISVRMADKSDTAELEAMVLRSVNRALAMATSSDL